MFRRAAVRRFVGRPLELLLVRVAWCHLQRNIFIQDWFFYTCKGRRLYVLRCFWTCQLSPIPNDFLRLVEIHRARGRLVDVVYASRFADQINRLGLDSSRRDWCK